ncbi:MAG: hypothetical protein OEO83_17005 [Alphaproteobacteria bacterium]|nr:hypothetical protein [Alphaproteobacteria bacterium]
MSAPPKQEFAQAIAGHLAGDEEPGYAMDDALEMLSAVDMAGLVLAPREPTREMLSAGASAAGLAPPAVHRMWRAMLAAAH